MLKPANCPLCGGRSHVTKMPIYRRWYWNISCDNDSNKCGIVLYGDEGVSRTEMLQIGRAYV